MARIIELISSKQIPRAELLAFLEKAGMERYDSPYTAYTYRLKRGDAQIWVELDTEEDSTLPEHEARIEQKLGGPAHTRLFLNIGNQPDQEDLAIELACQFAERWPLVVDSLEASPDSIYTAEEVVELRRQHRGFGRSGGSKPGPITPP